MEKEALVASHQELVVPSPEVVVFQSPLIISPLQEPVVMNDFESKRIHELEEYLHLIGESKRFDEIKQEQLIKQPHYERTDYTREQKKWIKTKRDESLDLAPYPHLTDNEPRHLHHVYAQGFLQAYLGLANHPELISHPHNGITLSKIAHVGPYIPGVNESRHPDVHSALHNLRQNPEAFRAVFARHWEMALEGVKYWVASNDSDMIAIATERTNHMRELKRQKEVANGK